MASGGGCPGILCWRSDLTWWAPSFSAATGTLVQKRWARPWFLWWWNSVPCFPWYLFVPVAKLVSLAGAHSFPVHGGTRTRPVARRGRNGSIVTLPFGVGRLRFGFGCPGFLILRFISWLISRVIVYSTPYQIIRTLRHKTGTGKCTSAYIYTYIITQARRKKTEVRLHRSNKPGNTHNINRRSDRTAG